MSSISLTGSLYTLYLWLKILFSTLNSLSFFFFSDGPVFTKKPSDVHAYRNSRVQFECQAEGIPKPNISWSLNGRELSTSSYTRVGDGVLEVRDLVFSDKGMYQCFAKGHSGKVQASGQLFVYYEGKD